MKRPGGRKRTGFGIVFLIINFKEMTKPLETAANLVKVCLGISILAIPNVTLYGGYVPMAIITLIISIWNAFATQRVVDVIPYLTKPVTDTDDPLVMMMEEAMGKTGIVIIDFCYLITLVGGGLIAYEIVFNTLLSSLPWDEWHFSLGKSKLFWGGIYFLCVIPLSLLRNLSSMSFMSIGGLLALITSIILYVIYGGLHYKLHFDPAFLWPSSLQEFSKMFGVCCLCFAVPFYGTSSQRSMDDKSKFPCVLYGSLLFSGFFYIIVGVGCSLLYNQAHDRIADMFIEDIDHESIFFYVAAALLSLNSIFSYPIIAYPPVLCLENMLHDETNEDKTFVKSPKKIAIRLSVLLFVVIVGSIFPRFKDIISFVGSFAVTFGCFALPSFLHWKLIPNLSTCQKVIDWILIVVGLILMVVITTLSLVKF